MELPDYSDDLSISDEADLWRFVHSTHFVHDKNLGRLRPSSQCFSDSSDGTAMSVLLAEKVESSGRKASDLLTGNWLGSYLASFTAGFARNISKLGVTTQPPIESEPAHAWVFGKKTKSVRSKLAKEASWVIGPTEDGSKRPDIL